MLAYYLQCWQSFFAVQSASQVARLFTSELLTALGALTVLLLLGLSALGALPIYLLQCFMVPEWACSQHSCFRALAGSVFC